MNKRQREAARRVQLQHMLDTHPEYIKFMDALIDNPKKNLNNTIQPVIEQELKKARMVGVEIGFQGAMLQAYQKVKNMQTIDEIKACLRAEADAVRERMGLKSAFDENENLIVDTDDSEN